ncbi:F-type H+-transporting ATPase subunit b [Jhaorihella thermophila]|uniref:ATP synthase subunit b n=2 Tax=Jhaorihella thermophila TaxID=488547 RepID=A0A1H5XCK4_9RHOB|nr:F-type H+-transporting ATPase subunit b [Jhaorihella thermophila]
MRNLTALVLTLAAAPAVAAGDAPAVSLYNTNFVVLIAFVLFVGILVYFNVPKLLGNALDKRAEGIRQELEEARAMRDEAQSLLASYEKKQREVQEQADRIVAAAKEDAALVAEQAKADLEKSIQRRLAAAEEQIASAEAAAIKEVRDRAIAIAVAAAGDVIAKQMTAAQANKLIDEAIAEVDAKLH